MNRRGFLKALGGLVAAPVAAKVIPSILVAPEAKATYTTYLVGSEALISGETYLTAKMIRASVASLCAANVRPMYPGQFTCYMHPDAAKEFGYEF